jgi:hypothetical protein
MTLPHTACSNKRNTELLFEMMIQLVVFWAVTPSSDVVGYLIFITSMATSVAHLFLKGHSLVIVLMNLI